MEELKNKKPDLTTDELKDVSGGLQPRIYHEKDSSNKMRWEHANLAKDIEKPVQPWYVMIEKLLHKTFPGIKLPNASKNSGGNGGR